MIRLSNREPLPEHLRGGVVALGNFDGFHLGHQAVVGEALTFARELQRPCIVATFDPHPRRLFQPDAEPFRLTTLDQREVLFAAAGADAMLVFHFDSDMAAMPADLWIEQVLRRELGVAGVVTGEDFTFGKGRSGSPAVLQASDIPTRAVAAVELDGKPVSSSRIREALKAGDCAEATRLLTRPFAIRSIVQHGDKRGRELGYPTANVDLGSYLRPRYGIYAVLGRLADGRVVQGAASLGIRPTFDPPKELFEPHFLDFSGEIYGQEVEVELHRYLRGEQKFDSLAALTAQIEADCRAARQALDGH